MNFNYSNPVHIYFGEAKLSFIREYIKDNHKIIAFCSRSVLKSYPILDKIRSIVPNCEMTIYTDILSNPGLKDIQNTIDLYQKEKIDLVLGIGGGSVLDYAKAFAYMRNKEETLEEVLSRSKYTQNDKAGIPFIAMPTTSGTGSEVTCWATIWDMEHKQKYSLESKFMYAKAAFIVPELTISLPECLTYYTAMDALSHAFEAWWSIYSNEISDRYAEEAITLILENLQGIKKDKGNIRARENLALASLMAGLAFSNTKTTIVHSVSYPMTSYFNVNHGLACSLTLLEFLKYNESYIDDNKKKRLLKKLSLADMNALIERINEIRNYIGIPKTLHEAGIDEKGIDIILKSAFHPERAKNNPREVSEGELKKILRRIL